MKRHVPSDILCIIQGLQLHHMQVTGPIGGSDHFLYHVNGHALTEDELRELSAKHLLTSYDIFNYARIRSGRRAG
jgi:hypothetical protein